MYIHIYVYIYIYKYIYIYIYIYVGSPPSGLGRPPGSAALQGVQRHINGVASNNYLDILEG